MSEKDLDEMLFVSASEQYGDEYIEHLLEQYKIYISSIEHISDRRQKSNEFFLALNTALVALLGFVVAKTNLKEANLLLFLSAIAGITMCYYWYRIVLSYKGLNIGKFKVLHAIESRLPLALYDTEWEALGRGEDKNIYWPFTHIEWRIPWIFISVYVVLMLLAFPWGSVLKVIY